MKLWPRTRPDSLLGQLRSPPYLRWEAAAGKLWMVALVLGPLADKQAVWTRWLPITLLSAPLYLYLHGMIYRGPYRYLPWYAAGMVAIGLIAWPFNGVALGYVVSAIMCLAYLPTIRQWLATVALLYVPVALVSMRMHVSPWLMILVLFASLLSGAGHFLRMSNLRKESQLRLSQDEVRRLATLAERERIGRDLHDLLGHTLSLVALKSELARKLAQVDPPRAQREMEEVERVARHALGEVRAAVTGMRRSDIAAELVSARLMLEASGLVFEGEWPEGIELPPALEAPLALVLREAITNIHRHARARVASVRFQFEAGRFQMCISDNGCGGLAAHGNGVSGMRERIRALGGSLQIDSPARKGTTLKVMVPLSTQVAATEDHRMLQAVTTGKVA
ncbi:sensor histidine kinase [Dyella jiangningensis]|uniref:Two-component sensor histidine kinase n=1 Tax=Dyella jiangningensis TaxID=1379159 RepID=A0A328NZT2_9GAMM|nr:sensor histidine kinase [Dyella jiangningensis]RAO75500.1 two-component sensor histidine kinase [Dyella jiangningensis]